MFSEALRETPVIGKGDDSSDCIDVSRRTGESRCEGISRACPPRSTRIRSPYPWLQLALLHVPYRRGQGSKNSVNGCGGC